MNRLLTIGIGDEIVEASQVEVIYPDGPVEEQLLLDWLCKELGEDLGHEDVPPERLRQYYDTCDRIRYAGNGTYVFRGRRRVTVNFLVHGHVLRRGRRVQPTYGFELLWEVGGVCRSLESESVIDRLLMATM